VEVTAAAAGTVPDEGCFKEWATLNWKLYRKKILPEIRNEANCILSFGVEAALLQGASRWFARGRKAAERGCFYKSS
jgi:hypothetical protein